MSQPHRVEHDQDAIDHAPDAVVVGDCGRQRNEGEHPAALAVFGYERVRLIYLDDWLSLVTVTLHGTVAVCAWNGTS